MCSTRAVCVVYVCAACVGRCVVHECGVCVVYGVCGGIWDLVRVWVCIVCSGYLGHWRPWKQGARRASPPGLGEARERQAAPPPGGQEGVWDTRQGWTPPATPHYPHPWPDLWPRSREEMLPGKAWQVPEGRLRRTGKDTPPLGLLGPPGISRNTGEEARWLQFPQSRWERASKSRS